MKMMNGRVLVKPDPKKEVTEGGILVPDKHQDAPSSGVILHSPPNSELQPGIRIHYFTYAGTEVRLNSKIDPQASENQEKVYHVVSEKDILFIE